MIYGYARVSSKGQERYGTSLEAQEEVLRQAGAEKVYCEAYTGTKRHRPKLDALLEVIGEGDTLIVTKLDRIARSTADGIGLIEELTSKGVRLNILNMGVFDDSPTGKLMRTVMLAFAEFERDMIVTRTQEGKAVRRSTDPDYREGRKPVLKDREEFLSVRRRHEAKEISLQDALSQLKMSKATYYRYCKAI